MTTFTIGKHPMRNGEEAEIIAVGRCGVLIGYIDQTDAVENWDARGRQRDDHETPYDLMPPAPPKLEPMIDYIIRNKFGAQIGEACRTKEMIMRNFSDADKFLAHGAPHTIHRRTTEQES